ncbi:MAG: biopolymer transporter ExbD [Pseudomonadales bacterium]|jgi:biopolymer transport protein ExbD|nr:biopolymer transporter ExbD [Pseudomonadales bacterium]
MRLRRHVSESHESSHGIDLAPMLDFVMNLLIFFIITAIFLKQFGFPVNRPEASQSNSESSSIQIQVLASGEVFMDGRQVEVRAVRANIERLKALKPEAGVVVIMDPTVKASLLIPVADQVRQGGISNITVLESN